MFGKTCDVYDGFDYMIGPLLNPEVKFMSSEDRHANILVTNVTKRL